MLFSTHTNHKCTSPMLKRALIVTLLWGLCFPMFADDEKRIQKGDVPAKVHAALAAAYPKARHIQYTVESEDGKQIYEIDFKVGRRNIQAHYREDGSLIRVDTHTSDDEGDDD